MLIRLQPSFIETTEKINDKFSEQDREDLSEAIEANYENIRLIMLEQEKSKNKSKPTLLRLGNIGSRFFALSIYYNDDVDDIYRSVLEN
jgi:PBP1b-binding outer membrane lipoprotein LpoB